MEAGWIEVICGSMFSGKTEELIWRVRFARIAGQSVQVFKPVIDDRYTVQEICSHNGLKVQATSVVGSEGILKLVERQTSVVTVDEVQFFDYGIVEICRKLASLGVRVIVAGLDMDFRGNPFGDAVPELLALAREVTKLVAVCDVCKQFNATHTQRLVNGQPAPYNSEVIQVGGKETYQARCADCHEVFGRP